MRPIRVIHQVLFTCLLAAVGCGTTVDGAESNWAADTIDVQKRTIQNQADVACQEERGMIRLAVADTTYTKRFVLRYPEEKASWNGRVLIGAHGGSGGKLYTRDGTETGTSETALDDVIADYALARGYIYASVDRDGIGGTREGLRLTNAFTDQIKERVQAVYNQTADYVFLAGLSAGGAVTRYAAENPAGGYDGALIIAGGGGVPPPQLDRQAKLAVLWPDVDPVIHPDRPLTDARVKAYAELIGTPIEARRFWSFVGARQTLDGLRRTLERYGLKDLTDDQLRNFQTKDYEQNETFMRRVNISRGANFTSIPTIPVIEVAGTYDDVVMAGIFAYKAAFKLFLERVRSGPRDLHRLYQVNGVWHISSDDDAIGTFQYFMKQMGIGEEAQDQLATGGTYRPAVEQALGHLEQWVTAGVVPPPDQTIEPSGLLE